MPITTIPNQLIWSRTRKNGNKLIHMAERAVGYTPPVQGKNGVVWGRTQRLINGIPVNQTYTTYFEKDLNQEEIIPEEIYKSQLVKMDGKGHRVDILKQNGDYVAMIDNIVYVVERYAGDNIWTVKSITEICVDGDDYEDDDCLYEMEDNQE